MQTYPSQARLAAAVIKVQYPEGCLVRVRPEKLDTWLTAIAPRLKDRIGEVALHLAPDGAPLVRFHAIGQRSEIQVPFGDPADFLEIVSDEEEIMRWREDVAASTSLRVRRSRKRLR